MCRRKNLLVPRLHCWQNKVPVYHPPHHQTCQPSAKREDLLLLSPLPPPPELASIAALSAEAAAFDPQLNRSDDLHATLELPADLLRRRLRQHHA